MLVNKDTLEDTLEFLGTIEGYDLSPNAQMKKDAFVLKAQLAISRSEAVDSCSKSQKDILSSNNGPEGVTKFFIDLDGNSILARNPVDLSEQRKLQTLTEDYTAKGFSPEKAHVAAQNEITAKVNELVKIFTKTADELGVLRNLGKGFSDKQESDLMARFQKTSRRHIELIKKNQNQIVSLISNIDTLNVERVLRVRERAQPRVREIDKEIIEQNEILLKCENLITRYSNRLGSLHADNVKTIKELEFKLTILQDNVKGLEAEFSKSLELAMSKRYETN